MNDLRFGAAVRAERRRRRLRQSDVAARASLSQQTVSALEHGQLDSFTLHSVRAVCRALEISVELSIRTHGPEPDSLLDARHSALVQAMVAKLAPGWTVMLEFSFSEYGERGCVDVLAWHPAHQAVLLVEVKSELVDVQALLRGIDVKARIVPTLLSKARGWRPRHLGSILVLPDESASRRAVDRYGVVFSVALPTRTVEVRHWLQAPEGPLRGILFLSSTPDRRAIRNSGSRGRVWPVHVADSHAQCGMGEARPDPATARPAP
jgi:transcriptional regulator with XRE-family HTH domain